MCQQIKEICGKSKHKMKTIMLQQKNREKEQEELGTNGSFMVHMVQKWDNISRQNDYILEVYNHILKVHSHKLGVCKC